jgi:hypothetical protein
MSFVKKSDVKNHLSAHDRHGIHLCRPGSEPVATDFSDGESEHADANINNSDGSPIEQPPSSAMTSTSPLIGPEPAPGSVSSQAESKSAQE